MGLEGFDLPVLIEKEGPVLLHENVTSMDSRWLSYINELTAETDIILDKIQNTVREKGIAIKHVLKFTTMLSIRSTENDLKEILASEERDLFAWLDAPGELELGIERTTVHVDEIASSLGLDGDQQIVALLDGEIDDQHPGLRGRVERKGNFSDSPWGTDGSLAEAIAKNHGTKVGAIVAGDGTSSAGDQKYRGVAPKAKIWNYRIAPSTSDGSGVAAALEAACIDGARVANLSWGQSHAIMNGRSVWARTVDAAFVRGMLTIKSVGNLGPAAGSLTSPADAQEVVSVGATDPSGMHVYDSSSRGPTTTGLRKPEIVAPGEKNGTSFAAPIVSGIALLALQGNPDWTVNELRARLIAACKPIAGAEEGAQGAGLINARTLLSPEM
jgi:hypothetical protein